MTFNEYMLDNHLYLLGLGICTVIQFFCLVLDEKEIPPKYDSFLDFLAKYSIVGILIFTWFVYW